MVDQPLRDRLVVQIDPTWSYRYLWSHPLGLRLNRIVYVDWEAGVQENASPNYADTDVVGRGELYKHWVSTANREVVLTFKFRVQGSGKQAIYDEVIYPARFLDKLKYPVHDFGTGQSYSPPTVLLRIGQLLMVRAVVTNADIQWVEPYEPESLLPHGADVPVTFSVVRRSNEDMGYRDESLYSGKWR